MAAEKRRLTEKMKRLKDEKIKRLLKSVIKPVYIAIGLIIIFVVLWGIFGGKKEEQKPAEAPKVAAPSAQPHHHTAKDHLRARPLVQSLF